MNVILLVLWLIWYAPICWVIPPNSPETTFASLRTSSTEVFPWSTWPITVTIGGLFFKFSDFTSFIFSIISSAFFSRIGLWPNSLTKYSAVSASIVWFIVTVTPIPSKCLIMLLDCSAILFASSLIVITSGRLTSLFTCWKLSLLSVWLKFRFSFCLALFKDAKLLDFASTWSSLKALEIVNFNSLLLLAILLDLLSFCGASPFSLLVALCSANFLFSKSDEGCVDGREKLFGLEEMLLFDLKLLLLCLENWGFLANFEFFFSITTVFLDFDLASSILLKVFFELPDIDNFNFFFSITHLSIFINFVSCWHY